MGIIELDKKRREKKLLMTRKDHVQVLQFKNFNDLLEKLTCKDGEKRNYTPKQAAKLADFILDLSKSLGYNYNMETPIEEIINALGLKVLSSPKIQNNASGMIYVNGTTNKCYGYDKVIMTNENESFEHQRFVAAHELGHYLIDCLGDSHYRDKKFLFTEPYHKGDQNSSKEVIVDRFAAELLMPRDLFIEQYINARDDKKYNPSGDMRFITEYLAEYFKVKRESVIKRIKEVFYDDGF